VAQLVELRINSVDAKTLLRAGFALAVFCSWPPGVSICQTVCPAASVSPNSVAAGVSPTMTLSTNGTIDLGNVTTQQFWMKPTVGTSNYKIIAQSAQELRFSMDIASSATPDLRTLFVNDASGHEVALDVNITSPVPKCTSHCKPGDVCTSGVCTCSQLICPRIGGICKGDNCILSE
jgi:hypothetical protein